MKRVRLTCASPLGALLLVLVVSLCIGKALSLFLVHLGGMR